MSTCCSSANREGTCSGVSVQRIEPTGAVCQSTCPRCEATGKAVETRTVQALLAVSLQAIRRTGYHFCRTPDCPVVYFSNDGQQTFVEAELREKVHQKHPDDDEVMVCYCFRHTPGTIRAELDKGRSSTVITAIQAGIEAGQCACEIRNPQGSCCLGNIYVTLKRIRAASSALPLHTCA